MNNLLEPYRSADLLELGTKARALRCQFLPSPTVTYTVEESLTSIRRFLVPGMDVIQFVGDLTPDGNAIRPVCAPGLTAVDYLRLVALCRIAHPSSHIEVDWTNTGLKVGQLALQFGADDFGCITTKPSVSVSEEQIRRIIRDAGFTPKRRDAEYWTCWLD